MEHLFIWFTLNTGTDPWSLMLGPLGGLVIALFGNIYQARQLKSEREENKRLTEVMRTDSKESMQILAAMDKTLDKIISQQGDGEKRITQQIVTSAQDLKTHVDNHIEHLRKRIEEK